MPSIFTREQLAQLNDLSYVSDFNNNFRAATSSANIQTLNIASSVNNSQVSQAMQSGLQQSQQFIANAEQSVVETELLIQQQQREREEIKRKADHAMQKMQQAKNSRANKVVRTLQALQDGVRLIDDVIKYNRTNKSITANTSREIISTGFKSSNIRSTTVIKKPQTTLAKNIQQIQNILLDEHDIKVSREEIERVIIKRSSVACAQLAMPLANALLASATGAAIVQYFIDNNVNKPTILITPNPQEDDLTLKPQEQPKPYILPGFSIHSNNKPNIFITPTQQAIIWSLQKKSGKTTNDKHANSGKREAAKEKYEEARAKFKELDKTRNKTPKDKKARDKARKIMNKAKQDMDFTGETHGRRSKKT
ncbi:MAG: hypothetical protein COB50_04275 [Thiotrichales bacterium]|nr:MAG: hypothetical protein COB50_04275 [Thiotrichales bacterium]